MAETIITLRVLLLLFHGIKEVIDGSLVAPKWTHILVLGHAILLLHSLFRRRLLRVVEVQLRKFLADSVLTQPIMTSISD